MANPVVSKLQKQAQDAFNKYAGFVSDSSKFKENLEKTLKERTNYNKDLIEQRNRIVSQRQQLPTQLRENFASSAIRDPLAQERLISGRAAGFTERLGNVQDLLSNRGQLIDKLVGQGVEQYGNQANVAQMVAQQARQNYMDALEQMRWEQEMALRRAQSSGGGGGGGGGIADMLAALMGPGGPLAEQGTGQDISGLEIETGGKRGGLKQIPTVKKSFFNPSELKKIPGTIKNIRSGKFDASIRGNPMSFGAVLPYVSYSDYRKKFGSGIKQGLKKFFR